MAVTMDELDGELETLLNKEESLMAEKITLRKEVFGSEQQLRDAKAKAYRGEYSDAAWFRKIEAEVANVYAEMKDIDVELLHTQKRIGRVKGLIKDKAHATREALFIRVAKENLPPGEMKRYWDIVEDRIDRGSI